MATTSVATTNATSFFNFNTVFNSNSAKGAAVTGALTLAAYGALAVRTILQCAGGPVEGAKTILNADLFAKLPVSASQLALIITGIGLVAIGGGAVKDGFAKWYNKEPTAATTPPATTTATEETTTEETKKEATLAELAAKLNAEEKKHADNLLKDTTVEAEVTAAKTYFGEDGRTQEAKNFFAQYTKANPEPKKAA